MTCIFRTNPAQKVQDDYTWYKLNEGQWQIGPHSGNQPDKPEAQDLARTFSAIRVGSSFLVLKRDTDRGPLLTLTVGAPIARVEAGQHHRPLSDTLYLQAENGADVASLCAFAAACFAADDNAQGLGNPASVVGAAVDEIWKTASLAAFTAKFGGVVAEAGGGWFSGESWIYPRTDLTNRLIVAKQIGAMVRSGRPFLVALTDRSPNEALQAVPDFKGDYRVFSARVEQPQKVVARPDFPTAPSWLKRTGLAVAALVAVVAIWPKAKKPSSPASPTSPSVISQQNSKVSYPTNCPNKPITSGTESSTNSPSLKKLGKNTSTNEMILHVDGREQKKLGDG